MQCLPRDERGVVRYQELNGGCELVRSAEPPHGNARERAGFAFTPAGIVRPEQFRFGRPGRNGIHGDPGRAALVHRSMNERISVFDAMSMR